MNQNPILAGSRIEMKKLCRTFKKRNTEECYVSRFLNWQDKDTAQIAVPVLEGKEFFVETGETYLVCFYTQKGPFCCRAVVKECRYQETPSMITLRFLSGLEKYQKRQYYRMACALNMSYRLKDMPEKETQQSFEAVAVDISGGGLRFNSAHAAEAGEEILVSLVTGTSADSNLQSLHARILSSVPLAKRHGMTEHRAEFIGITTQERECIIQYIFLEERNRRKKGGWL